MQRYGLIGTGMMGCEHLRNLALLDDACVTAVADPNPTSRQWAADNLAWGPHPSPDAAILDDPAALLARDDVDAVIIATPNHTHIDVVPTALAAGKHVLVEKPFATTVADCIALEDAAAAHPDRIVGVAMEYRWMAPVAAAIAAAHDGTCGRLHRVAIREHRFPFLPKVDNWNRYAANTGGTLVEKCCHFFDLMRLVLDDTPERVFASGAQDVNHLDENYDGHIPDIVDNAYVIVDFAGGTRALLDLCMFAEGSADEQELCIVGDAGKVEAFIPSSRLRIGRRSDPGRADETFLKVPRSQLQAGSHHGATLHELAAFCRALRGDAAYPVSPNDGTWAVAMGQAAERSAATGQPVALADLPGFTTARSDVR